MLSIAIVLLKKKCMACFVCSEEVVNVNAGLDIKTHVRVEQNPSPPRPLQPASPVLLTELPERPEMREIARPDLP